jgi:hypothetical protein
MKSAKQQVIEMLKGIPEHSTLEDIQYHLYVRQKVLKGLDAARKGQVIPHEDAIKRARKWLKK